MGSDIRLLTTVLTVIMIRPAIIRVRTGYCPSNAMYLNTTSRAAPIGALNCMTIIMIIMTASMPNMVLLDIGGACCCISCIFCELPGLGIFHHSDPKNPLITGFISIICSRPMAS